MGNGWATHHTTSRNSATSLRHELRAAVPKTPTSRNQPQHQNQTLNLKVTGSIPVRPIDDARYCGQCRRRTWRSCRRGYRLRRKDNLSRLDLTRSLRTWSGARSFRASPPFPDWVSTTASRLLHGRFSVGPRELFDYFVMTEERLHRRKRRAMVIVRVHRGRNRHPKRRQPGWSPLVRRYRPSMANGHELTCSVRKAISSKPPARASRRCRRRTWTSCERLYEGRAAEIFYAGSTPTSTLDVDRPRSCAVRFQSSAVRRRGRPSAGLMRTIPGCSGRAHYPSRRRSKSAGDRGEKRSRA